MIRIFFASLSQNYITKFQHEKFHERETQQYIDSHMLGKVYIHLNKT